MLMRRKHGMATELRFPQSLQVGDILVMGDRGAQILVQPQLADFLCEALTSVRRAIKCASAAVRLTHPTALYQRLSQQADSQVACAHTALS
jgi:RNA-binding protein YlmH